MEICRETNLRQGRLQVPQYAQFEAFLAFRLMKSSNVNACQPHKNVIFQILRKNFKKIGKNYLKSVDKQLKGGIMLAVEDVEC